MGSASDLIKIAWEIFTVKLFVHKLTTEIHSCNKLVVAQNFNTVRTA